MKTRLFAILLTGLFLFSSSLEAQMRGSGYEDRGQRGERPDRVRLHDKLNLSAEQEKKLSEIRTAHQKQMIDNRAEFQKMRLSIREEMRKETPNMRTVEDMIKKQETVRTNMQLARIQHWNNIREILTPEQREIWQQHRRDFREFGERHGPRQRGYHRGRR